LHLHEFHPGAIVALSLAVLCAVIWRTLAFRLMALPLAALGIVLAASGPVSDLLIAPTGDALATRGPDGLLLVLGRRPSPFMVEQWLRSDADGRPARDAVAALSQPTGPVERMSSGRGGARCDRNGCVATLPSGKILALTLEHAAFAEDCTRAAILVTPLYAPDGCGAGLVIDRGKLAETGAMALQFGSEGQVIRAARATGEDRAWSPAPRPAPRRQTFARDDDVDEAPPFQ
jgi:competence protein ComEC